MASYKHIEVLELDEDEWDETELREVLGYIVESEYSVQLVWCLVASTKYEVK
jgi:C1A family cysteine protease